MLLRELYRRDLGQQITFAALIARLVSHGLNIDNRITDSVLKLYVDELTQDVYSTSRLLVEREKVQKDRKLLEAVEKLSVNIEPKSPLTAPPLSPPTNKRR